VTPCSLDNRAHTAHAILMTCQNVESIGKKTE
jgi:hypothetical protein